MKEKEVNKTPETDHSQKEEQPENIVTPPEKEIVIQDECGDSLWDAVLMQDAMKELLAQGSDKKKGHFMDGKKTENDKSE